MSTVIRIAALVLTSSVGLDLRTALPQSAADSVAVENAIAMFIRPRLADKVTLFDGSFVGAIEVDATVRVGRGAERAAELAALLGAELRGLDTAVECDTTRVGSCQLDRADVALRLGLPTFEGDSAYIWVYSRRVALIDGIRRLNVSDVKYLLGRAGAAGWRVVRAVEMHVT